MDLRDVTEEIAAGVEFELGKLSDNPVERIGQVCDIASDGFRTLAGSALLLDADTDSYYHLLANSAAVRLYFLDRCQREKASVRDPYRATGNSAALFAAIAARHFDLAGRMAALSPNDWWEGEEYGEDFYFAHFFHLLLAHPKTDPAQLQQALRNLKAADGAPARPRVCEALVDRDQEAFDDAFNALLGERATELAELGEPFTPYDAAARHVAESLYTEGLAILNVADWLRLATQREYPRCPAAARIK